MINIDKLDKDSKFWDILDDEQKSICERYMTLTLRIKLLNELKEVYSPVDFSKFGITKMNYDVTVIERDNSNPPLETMIDTWINEIKKELDEIKPKVEAIYNEIFVESLISSYKEVFNETTMKALRGEYNRNLFKEFVNRNPGTHVTDDTMPFILNIVNGYTEFLFNTFGKKEEKTE